MNLIDCGSTLTNATGSIASPDYPNKYSGPVDCVWNIHGQPGEVIVLNMSDFHLPASLKSSSNCSGSNDDSTKSDDVNKGYKFEVRDGLNDSLIGTFPTSCASAISGTQQSPSVPPILTSHSNRMYIKYTVDGGEMVSGDNNFQLNYRRGETTELKRSILNKNTTV